MPEYRRFIAYFYEYIDGKRGKNAGFVKAEQRNGTWRLRIQLRSGRWPKESLQILGFTVQEEKSRSFLLGRGYPNGENMIQTIVIRSGDAGNQGTAVEQLSGMWVPAGEGRCFLSNWENREMDVGMLRLPEENAEEGTERRKAQDTKVESGGAEGTMAENTVEENAAAKNIAAKSKGAGGTEAEKVREESTEAGSAGAAGRQTEYGREKQSADVGMAGTDGGAKAAGRVGMENLPGNRRNDADCDEGGNRADTAARDETRNRADTAARDETGNRADTAARDETGEMKSDTAASEAGVEAMECTPGNSRPDMRDRQKNQQAMEQSWNILRARSLVVHPFPDEPGAEYLHISPADVRWLGMHRWPVGQNSFIIQSFHRYRHILFGRRTDGSCVLGVPGRETPQLRGYARRFGFPDFREADGEGYPDGFGYWIREITVDGDHGAKGMG